MSSVLARKRGLSEMEFYRVAVDIKLKYPNVIMNENIVPKRWRPWYMTTINAALDSMMEYILAANRIYPYHPEEVTERKRLQQLALIKLDVLDDKLQELVDRHFQGRVYADRPIHGDLVELGDLIDRENMFLTRWRTSTKLLKDPHRP